MSAILNKILTNFSKYRIVVLLGFVGLIAGIAFLINDQMGLKLQLRKTQTELSDFKNQDQVKRNDTLEEEIKNINQTYKNSISVFEKLTDFKAQKQETSKLDPLYAQVVNFLANKNYASASSALTDLNNQMTVITAKAVASAIQAQVPAKAPTSNTPPGSGFSFQSVSVDGATYNVAIVAADLNSTKVIIDTASDSDCGNNCPTLPLADYVSRNGAYAGINGSYFCPAEYPSCAGKTGSFDTLLMNKNKHYFNSDNNVYSTIPAAIFSPGSARFVGQSSQWGRDTGVDGVIANYPLLIAGGSINFTEAPNEPKFGGKAARTFIAAKGSTVYIGIVYGATMGESAKVLKALGVDGALNLDQGGSTALWSGGYKAGPGRNIPNAVLFVKR
ncbi:MAG: phosphodiester glycosidase family protein [Candidatus Daviesbacteria bacterium]|nr:phosphodiester glycosidase family protein [Candidatus Daviesbacteria bacterium]